MLLSPQGPSDGACEPLHADGLPARGLLHAWQVNEYLKDRQQPIWASLSATRTELYRDIQAVYYGHSPFLSRWRSWRLGRAGCV